MVNTPYSIPTPSGSGVLERGDLLKPFAVGLFIGGVYKRGVLIRERYLLERVTY